MPTVHDPSEPELEAGPTLSMTVYGTDEPPAPTRLLRAGPISATLDAGNLRHVRFGAVEIIRAVSFMVRDTAWGTYRPRVEDLRIDEGGGSCRVSYRATCAGPEGTFRYGATITLAADGTIAFAVEGSPVADFPTNRTGFVVLHPLEGVAGCPLEVLHTDGRVEHTRFPVLIEPWQPVFDIRALTHEPHPGLVVTCGLEGDAYEMEDHRNWGDASYKTYVRPLAKGYPYEIPAGERVAQSVHITATQTVAPSRLEHQADEPVRIALGAGGGHLPSIGLAVDAADAEAALAHRDVLAAAGVQSLIVRFDARHHGAREARAAEALRQALGTAATLEVVIPGHVPQTELAAVAVACEEGRLHPSAVVVSPVRDLTSRPSGPVTGEASLGEICSAAREAFPEAQIGGGTFAYFTEFNRNPPDTGLDFVTHSFAANIHAADDLSVMETLETVPHMARTVRERMGPPHHIGFAAIGMRESPYGAGPAPNPYLGRVASARVDPRHAGLYGAAWVLGFAASAASEEIQSLGLAMPTGPFGLVSDSGGSHPVFAVVRGLAAIAKQSRRKVKITRPGVLQALACSRDGGEVELWVANLTPHVVDAALDGVRPTKLSVLDENSCARPTDPFSLIGAPERSFPTTTLRLSPYAIARVVGDPASVPSNPGL